MKPLNQKKFGLAVGISSIAVYISCVILMSIIGEAGIIRVSNLLFHGMEFSNIIRMDIPLTDNLIGIAASFFVWGGIGYIIATVYNKLTSWDKFIPQHCIDSKNQYNVGVQKIRLGNRIVVPFVAMALIIINISDLPSLNSRTIPFVWWLSSVTLIIVMIAKKEKIEFYGLGWT